MGFPVVLVQSADAVQDPISELKWQMGRMRLYRRMPSPAFRVGWWVSSSTTVVFRLMIECQHSVRLRSKDDAVGLTTLRKVTDNGKG